ncbi:MAG TPA: AEC family transporter [Spirochaetia bacterium]|nr:AEC family transporter [Spirochaetales bacterium]HRS65452.1 AEC family transporter [Spirochaetia bacterium]HOT59908.1 AEC family transporter [Spirochaetales bacterium]HPD80690.1 AEC family transporter [Spirochaetales bacterium]HQK34510.1 AEC family transporter [Spirochaetales bacterium]
MTTALIQSFVLFALMFIGYILGKLKVITNFKELSRLVVDLTLPALILVSMQKEYSHDTASRAFSMLAISGAVYAGALLLSYFLPLLYKKVTEQERGVHRFAMSFSNVGFMGFPIAAAFLGSESLFDVSMYNIPFQILAFSIGVLFIAPHKSKKSILSKKLLVNPAIMSALVGFILFLLQIKIPSPLFTVCSMLGETTTPLAMLIIGGILSQSNIKQALSNPHIWLTTLYRLALFPLMLYGICILLGIKAYAVPVLIAAMPVAANTSMLAEVYGGDSAVASGLVMLSTLLSTVTIPLIAILLTA